MNTDQEQALQAVVDRVQSYQATAESSTIESELREALIAADLNLKAAQVDSLVAAIAETDGPVDVATVLPS